MKSQIIRNKRFLLTSIFILFSFICLQAQLSFTTSNSSLSVCKNAAAGSINNLLSVADNVSGETLTWSVNTAPGHGTLTGFNATATSNGGTVTPAGLNYKPATGYSGSDVFTIQVSNGSTTATTTVNVTINPPPSAPVFTVYTTEVYQGQFNVQYAVALDPNGNIFNWIYTGSGVTINNVSTSNNMTIDFSNEATEGSLFAQISGLCGNSPSSALPIKIVSTLPVTFVDFKVQESNDKFLLQWSTASEFNSRSFVVQRSTDGGAHWQSVGTVAAAGNSDQLRQYQFSDAGNQKGKRWYRLKQIDKDESFMYSKVISITKNAQQHVVYSVYPNPAKDVAFIQSSSAQSESVSVRLIDFNGKVVQQQQATFNSTSPIKLSLENVPSGMYFVRVTSPTQDITEKIMVTH